MVKIAFTIMLALYKYISHKPSMQLPMKESEIVSHSVVSEEKATAPHSSTLAWKIPWMEEPGRLQSMGSWRVGHDWATSLSLSLSCIREGNGNPLQCSCLENLWGGGAWWAAVYGVAQSGTRLKQLSSSSSCVWLIATLWTVAYQAPLSMGFSRQE